MNIEEKELSRSTYKHSYKTEDHLLSSLSVCNVGYQSCEPDYQWGPGLRNHYCIHHILSGKGYYEANGIQYELTAGDSFILYPNTEVKYYADSEEPWEYAWVGFTGSDARTILALTDFSVKQPIIRKNVADAAIRQQLSLIFEVKGNTYLSAVSMTGGLYTLLSLFMKHATPKARPVDTQTHYIDKALDYIANNYSYPITIEEVAEYAGVSRSHLYRCFQSHLQLSPKEYLTQYRIRQACYLLTNTDLPVSTIAYSVGFENNLYFSKAFKQQVNQTPSSYRSAL
ncbi:MAG: helix-turn-helix domain-containing protein [Lachnospiraceae bacterium]